MQGNPPTTSGTYGVASAFTNAECLFEAYSRCQIRETSLQGHHMMDGLRSIQLTLQSLTNKGINLFQRVQHVIPLVANQATYLLPPEVVSIVVAYYNVINTTGIGPDYDSPAYDPSQPVVTQDPQITIARSSDRWMKPMGADDYARIPNKTDPGLPTRYWFNRIGPPAPTTMTLWQPPSQGYPQVAVTYFAIRQIQDANIQGGERPDVVTRFLDWLCAELARRLARKYAPQLIGSRGSGGLLDDAEEAWALASGEDTDKAEVRVMPEVYRYWRM